MVPNTPIVNAGVKYVNGLDIAKTAAKVISMAAGAARDSSNVDDIVLSSAASINGAVVGANGVDVAVLAASSQYAVYVIGDSKSYNATAGLLSLSASAPSLPAGYDMYRRVGWVQTDGSSNILQFWQYGSSQNRSYYWDVPIAVTTSVVTSFTAVSVAGGVPPIDTQVILKLSYTAASAANAVEFLPYGSSGTVGVVHFGCGAAVLQKGNVTVPSKLNAGVPTILYKMVTSDAMTTAISGYADYLS